MSAAGAGMGRVYEATWGRAFAALYDRSLRGAEEDGLGRMRAELLAGAGGRVIELGAGTGVNLDLYPVAVTGLTLVEPDQHMAKRLRERLAESGRQAEIVAAPAERLPFADASFETAVSTLVLCTVPDPDAALAELKRVLAPGGRLLFIEHVRAEDPGLARWQDRLQGPWRFLGDGCHCNRDTVASLRGAGFALDRVESDRLTKVPTIIRPLVRGTAAAPGQAPA